MTRICVVEDDDSTRSAVKRFLEFGGYEVVTYADAQPALDAEGRFDRVDLVLTDSSMPTPAGTLLAAFLDMELTVPVIVMSGNFHDKDRELYTGLGAALLVDKPVGLDNLTEAITTVLGKPGEGTSE